MKQPKKPTLEQKKLLRKKGLNEKDWSVESEDRKYVYPYFKAVNKKTGDIEYVYYE